MYISNDYCHPLPSCAVMMMMLHVNVVCVHLQEKDSGVITFYMKGADVVMSNIVQYSDWLEEEVCVCVCVCTAVYFCHGVFRLHVGTTKWKVDLCSCGQLCERCLPCSVETWHGRD